MKYILFLFIVSSGYAVISDELVNIHHVTVAEMNNINTPQAGSLIYNRTEDTIFFYTGSIWKRLKSTGSETIITSGNQVITTGNGNLNTPYIIGQ